MWVHENCNFNEVCFYENNLTPSIKHLVSDYSHKNRLH